MSYLVATDNGSNWADPSTATLAGSTTNPADDWVAKDTYLNGQVLLDFNRTFAGKHNVTALAGWSQESKKHYSISAKKTHLNDLTQPSDGTVTDDKGTSLSTQDNTRSALQSYFGRVGYSYDDKRSFDGMMGEIRVWNKVLTAEEINAKDHFYKIDPASEGLVSYWKFNDNNTKDKVVKDYSGNGFHLETKNNANWQNVSVPAED